MNSINYYNLKNTANGSDAGEKSHNFGRKHSEETKKLISENNVGTKGMKLSEETRKKMSDNSGRANLGKCGELSHLYGRKHSEETIKKMSESAKGSKNHNYGKKFPGRVHTDETKKKISEAKMNSPDLVCPYCGKIGKVSGMTRWHFNNCKKK